MVSRKLICKSCPGCAPLGQDTSVESPGQHFAGSPRPEADFTDQSQAGHPWRCRWPGRGLALPVWRADPSLWLIHPRCRLRAERRRGERTSGRWTGGRQTRAPFPARGASLRNIRPRAPRPRRRPAAQRSGARAQVSREAAVVRGGQPHSPPSRRRHRCSSGS